MKYKTAEEIIEKIRHYDKMDDLIVFKKPYNKNIIFKMKNNTNKTIHLNNYSYISMSNKGFLFIKNNPYNTNTIHLNNVEDIIVE